MCVGFENKNVKIFPLFDDSSKELEQIDIVEEEAEAQTNINKPKKRPLRKFDDHLG
jgi:hypothetical protein